MQEHYQKDVSSRSNSRAVTKKGTSDMQDGLKVVSQLGGNKKLLTPRAE
jgi:hypothetical protein